MKALSKTVLLAFLIAGAFMGSWLFIQKKTKQRQVQTKTVSFQGKPDGFTNKIVYQDIDEEGRLKNQLTSTQLTHYPKEDSAQFTLPQFVLHGDSKQTSASKMPWVVRAKQAKTLAGHTIIKLYGQVSIDQAGDGQASEKHLKTEELIYYPKKNRLETRHSVILKQPDATIHATGLIADLNQDVVYFLADTRIVYKPRHVTDPHDGEKRFKTNRLLFRPRANWIETQDPIVLEQAGTKIYAKGLKADLNQNRVTFLSQTKIIYDHARPLKLP